MLEQGWVSVRVWKPHCSVSKEVWVHPSWVGWLLTLLGQWRAWDLAGVVGDLEVAVEDLEGAGAGFFGGVVCLHVCLHAVEGGLVFFGGSLGIFFFCSGILFRWLVIGGGGRNLLSIKYIGDCGW